MSLSHPIGQPGHPRILNGGETMLRLIKWLQRPPARDHKTCWKEVLEGAMAGGNAPEYPLEPMFDYLERAV